MRVNAVLIAGVTVLACWGAGCSNRAPTASGGATGTPGGSPVAPQASASSPSAPEASPPSGDIPDTVKFVDYTPAVGGFTLKYPESFARTESGGVATFTDKLNTLRVETVSATAQPTVASARATEVPAIAAAVRNYQPGTVATVTRKAGSAILITYQADSPVDPVTGKVVKDAVERYEFWKGGEEVILSLSGPIGADNVDPYKAVTDSFAWR